MRDEQREAQEHVDEIAASLEAGITYEDAGLEEDARELGMEPTEIISGYEYLRDALDIEYIVSKDKEYLGARILVAFGGPNIWVNTRTKTVELSWWGTTATACYVNDGMDLDDACAELWEC